MPPIDAGFSLIDVAFAVCTGLDAVGTRAVLTGGSAATFYAPSAYQSRDADFVITMTASPQAATAAMTGLGFTEAGGIYSHQSGNMFTVEFPPGPLAVGGDLIDGHDTVRRDGEVLYVLTRTDSVCDRLAGFYHWNDRSALAAAVAVAGSGAVDLQAIERWSGREGMTAKFAEFRAALDDQ
jgi:hypothetical protein